MKATRRRTRTPDPLASRVAVRKVLAQLQTALGAASPKTEKDLVSLLRAMGHTERHPAGHTGRGRKSRWSDYDKSRMRRALADILARETKRLGLRSFLEHYLLILAFPAEVAEALEAGRINLFEAEQLARLTAKRLRLPEAQSRQKRQALLRAHLQTAASGIRLKAKVDAVLQFAHQSTPGQDRQQAAEISLAAALERESEQPAGAYDWNEGLPPEHLFAEYLQLIGSLLHVLRPEELTETELERIADLAEPLIQFLNGIHKRQHPPDNEEGRRDMRRRFSI